MAQYVEPTSSLINQFQNSNVSDAVKSGIEDLLKDLDKVNVGKAEGGEAPKEADVLHVPKGEKLESDPGSKVIILDPDSEGADIEITVDTPRVIVGSQQSDKIVHTGTSPVTIETGGGADFIQTGKGDDVITITGQGQPTVDTGGGDDKVIITGENTATVNTGSGKDVIQIATDKGEYTVDAGEGFDEVVINDKKEAHHIIVKDGKVIVSSNAPTEIKNVEVIEFQDGITVIAENHTKGVVARLYKVLFDREADLEGLEYWFSKVDEGMSLKDIAKAFLSSKEFTEKFGDVGDVGFLIELYDNMADRLPDDEGFLYWLNQLKDGVVDKADVAIAFADSQEAIQIMGIDGEKYVVEVG